MTIADLVARVHQVAQEKGWYDKERSPLEMHMLMVSELAEATEAARKDLPAVHAMDGERVVTKWQEMTEKNLKPEGEAVELVDAIIRIADYFGFKGWDLQATLQLKMDYNEQRSYRHGGKKY